MNVRSVPSIPCGWKTRWSRTHSESNPSRSARQSPSMSRSWFASSPKCGTSKPKRVMSSSSCGWVSCGPCLSTPAGLTDHLAVANYLAPADQRVRHDAADAAPGVRRPTDLAEHVLVADLELAL